VQLLEHGGISGKTGHSVTGHSETVHVAISRK
jgi:hypothetical protein